MDTGVTGDRSVAVWTLTVATCLVLVFAMFGVGVQQLLLNTDRWVDTVGPLASDPRVQSSIAATAEQLTVNGIDSLAQASSLPAPLQGLARGAESGVSAFVGDQATRVVQSPQFAQLWVDLNRRAHASAVALLRGQTVNGGVRIADGQMELSLVMLIAMLLQGQVPLPNQLIAALPGDFGYVTVGRIDSLVAVQRALRMLDQFTTALLILAPILVAGTLLAAPQRWLAARRLAIGCALGSLVIAIVLYLTAQSGAAFVQADPSIAPAVQAAVAAVLMNVAQFMLVVFVFAAIAAGLVFLVERQRTRSATGVA